MNEPAHTTMLQRFPIRPGSHPGRGDGLCAMEMVAWLAGEDHTDGPNCTCPVIAAVVRAFNDALTSDPLRERHLRGLLPKLVNTVVDHHEQRARGYLIADYAVRVLGPLALARVGKHDAARALRRLPAILDRATALLAHGACMEQGIAVSAAAWVAARAAGTLPAQVWAAGVVRQARCAEGPEAWQALKLLVEQLIGTPLLVREKVEA